MKHESCRVDVSPTARPLCIDWNVGHHAHPIWRCPFYFMTLLLLLAAAPAPYFNDFEKAEEGKFPEELLAVDGQFTIVQGNRNQMLELPGNPLKTFGFLLGPEGATEVTGRIRATGSGRLFPEFGVGLGGSAGVRLWLMPAVKELQIVKDVEPETSIPHKWESGSWASFRFRVRKEGNKWVYEGKAWADKEPEAWTIRFEDSQAPAEGRASMWGVPYSGTEIWFDDVGGR